MLTGGSLFSGSGGFEEAGRRHGINFLWASEIEPDPIRVTKKNFPNMIHLGDVNQIDGAKIPPVDVITWGSPCQDISIAGKHAGIDGDRSGLFFEAIRIVKEMRKATNGKYPRYAVFENVKNVLRSNDGEDFRRVLEEFSSIQNPNASIPQPEKNKWCKAGAVMGDDFSIGWRVLDAQYWGVPQHRERLFLVADFGGGGHQRYYLSQKACYGILKRAKDAHKALPAPIQKALEMQIKMNQKLGS